MAVKRAKPPRRERQKLILVVILGICLGAILLWPKEAADTPGEALGEDPRARFADGSSEPSQPSLSPKPADLPGSTDSLGVPGSANRAARPKLPRLDSQTIAAADPFTPLSQLSAESAGPDDHPAEAIAAAAARASVRAVYRSSRGAAAIVDDQIIPVKDAKHWIATLRAAE